MKDLLFFYSDALKTVASATPEQIPALDRIMAQATGQIAQERLISIIERLVAPRQPEVAGTVGDVTADLADILTKMQGGEVDEAPERPVHPSPFADLDLGPDEPALSPEDFEADQQLREELKSNMEKDLDQILKNKRGRK